MISVLVYFSPYCHLQVSGDDDDDEEEIGMGGKVDDSGDDDDDAADKMKKLDLEVCWLIYQSK